MIRHLYTIISQVVLIDSITQLASFINEVEGLTVPQLPTNAPQLAITTAWCSDAPGVPLQARHRLLAPSGKEVMNIQLHGDHFPPNGDRQRQINITGGFLLPEAGKYWLVTERKEKDRWVEANRMPMLIQTAGSHAPQRFPMNVGVAR